MKMKNCDRLIEFLNSHSKRILARKTSLILLYFVQFCESPEASYSVTSLFFPCFPLTLGPSNARTTLLVLRAMTNHFNPIKNPNCFVVSIIIITIYNVLSDFSKTPFIYSYIGVRELYSRKSITRS